MRRKKRKAPAPLREIVKKRLIEVNKTQKELAQEIGASEKYLYLILYGYRSGEKYLPGIEKALGLDLQPYKRTA